MDYSKKPGRKLETYGKIINNSDPVISVVTPFYNGGETLLETAYSLFNQTYPFFEWIIVDDGSKEEDSLKKLDEVSKMDNRIRVFHKENGGPSLARDFGISKANKNSKYIYFLDCDDLIDKTMLECLYWTLETHPDASFSYTATVNFGNSEFLWEKYLNIKDEKKKNLICISSLVKKSDLLEVGCFGISEKSMYEDWNLWLKLLAKGKKPVRVSASLFWYRRSNTGELSRAKINNQNAMKYVKETALKVTNDVEVIQFPHFCQKSVQNNEYSDMVLPMYDKKTKKNILFLLPWMMIGGADIFNLELIKRLDKNLFDVTIVTTLPADNLLRQSLEEVASQVYDLSSFLEVDDYVSFVDYLILSRKITTIFVSNSTYGYSMLPYIKAKYPHIAVIDYVHSVSFDDGVGGFGKYSSDFDLFIDKTLTCNNYTKKELQDDFNKNNVETVYIGTDIKRFDKKKYDSIKLKDKYQIPSNKKIITFLARLSVEKRPLMFVEIASQLLKRKNNLFFLIVGDGPLYNDVKKGIQKLGINSNIKMLGATFTPEEIYAISDVTINCSYLEGLALTSYESLAMSVPVISTSVGGQKELINDSVGRIVECYSENEVEKYVDATIEVLKDLENLSSNASKRIKNQFSYDIMIGKMSDFFLNIKGNESKKNILLGLKKYRDYSMKTYREFNLQVKKYCWDKYRKYMDNEESTMEKKVHKIEKYLELLGNRYNATKEVGYLFDIIHYFAKFFQYLLKMLLAGCKFIFSLIMGILSCFVIAFKIFKKELTGKK